ncbi:MAG: murein biosynthesis integral membrane protein MurJ [Desulfobacteraceae bacterium]|nr:murein biosynthesis integral membrane protein MurJ [Desulfobacteraceae bacterium]
MSENTHVTKAAGVVGTATLASRILGFIRDAVIAWYFGAGLGSDAFFVAFRVPNTLRRLFAEGSLSIAFIPVFTEYLENRGKEEAFDMARAAIKLLSVILIVTSVLGILLAPFIVRVFAWGFASSPEKFALTVHLTRIMFPYVFFICLVALCMGILNPLRHFLAPSLAPSFLNIAMILSVIVISPCTANPATGLAIGVLIGGFLQLALQIPFLIKKGFKFNLQSSVFNLQSYYHPALERIGRLMVPAVFGAAVYQVNIVVGTLLASFLPEGSVSCLWFADRLVQFPLGIFGIATATAVLPSLSRQAAAKDFDALKDSFAYAIRLIFFITIPSMAGLIVLREPIVALLFKRGAFDAETTRLTAYALLCYSVGLWAFAAVRIVVSTFYALQDTKTPVRMAVISIFANIALGIILMGPLGHGGLALATSLASMLNLGLLVYALKLKLGTIKFKSISESVCKSVVCSVIMAFAVGAVANMLVPTVTGTLFTLLSGVLISIGVGCLLYGFLSFLLKSRELETVINIIKTKRKK